MINIDLQTGFVTYLCLLLGALVALGIYEWWRSCATVWHLSEDSLCQCPACHYTFLVKRGLRTAHCPRCEKRCSVYRKKV